MSFVVRRVSSKQLDEYAKIPISFCGNSILEVSAVDGGLGGFVFEEKPVEPFYKDYDDFETPLSWPEKFGISNWRFYLAYMGERAVSGATLVVHSREIRMLEGKDDLAWLWDIRVHPNWRGRGLGRALFQRAAQDARELGCRWLKVETQNNNVPANKFYQRQGCHLALVHLHAYYDQPECKDEVMLVWYLDLQQSLKEQE